MASRAPLRLGGAGGVGLEAERIENGRRAVLRGPTGELATLTKQGGGLLADWLIAWTRPRLKLWGVGDVMREMDIAESTLHAWRKHPDFPTPWETSSGPIWEAQAVRAWARRRPKPGRPRKRRAARR